MHEHVKGVCAVSAWLPYAMILFLTSFDLWDVRRMILIKYQSFVFLSIEEQITGILQGEKFPGAGNFKTDLRLSNNHTHQSSIVRRPTHAEASVFGICYFLLSYFSIFEILKEIENTLEKVR